MKIFFYPFQGIGHVNACIGLAQALRDRGHEIYFLVDKFMEELLTMYRMDSIILEADTSQVHEALSSSTSSEDQSLIESLKSQGPSTSCEISSSLASLKSHGFSASSGVQSSQVSRPRKLSVSVAVKDPLLTLEPQDTCDASECNSPIQKITIGEIPKNRIKLCRNCSNLSSILNLVHNAEPLIREAIENELPDLIIVDHFFIPPSIYYSGIPWVLLYSPNPLALYGCNKRLPPPTSGYPTKPIVGYRRQWRDFLIGYEKKIKVKHDLQNFLMKIYDRSEINLNETYVYLTKSPYLNIYVYPEELDYTDIVVPSSDCLRIDNICRKEDESIKIPKGLEEFMKKKQPNDKLVYITMGSSMAINPAVLMKIVNALINTPHKYIVSKGKILSKDYQLPKNMWGQDYLPQMSILPILDLMIIHGGNNTVTEAFYFGKPMIVIPMYSDEFDNAQRIDEKGYGIRLSENFTEVGLINAVNQLLGDDKLKQKMHRVSQRIQKSKSKQIVCDKLEQLAKHK